MAYDMDTVATGHFFSYMQVLLLILLGFYHPIQGFHASHMVARRSRVSKTSLLDAMDDRDWRAFRARLVLQEQEECSDLSINLLRDNMQEKKTGIPIHERQGRWIHEQTILEPGAVLIHTPRPQDLYGLGRHCLYKSVVLVLEASPSGITGIILNRQTDAILNSLNAVIQYGGDDYSPDSKDPRFYVMSSEKTGFPIAPDLFMTTVEKAQQLVEKGKAKAQDFSVYCGHASWPTFELESEMDRGIWKCLSVDVDTLRQTCNEPDFRKNLLKHVSERLVESPSDSDFDERMHREWSRLHLSSVIMGDIERPLRENDIKIQAGDLLRTSAGGHVFLFADQEFHNSLLLLIQEDEDFSVAVLLNHPTQATESLTNLPIRYGGNYRCLEDESEMPPFCLHYLGGVVGGEPVGDHFYKASVEQAAEAIEGGFAAPEDFMVAQGMMVWPKYDLSTGVGDSGCFKVVESKLVPDVWRLLSMQRRLSPQAMEANVDVGMQAWQAATGKKSHTGSRLLDLGMDAVKTWLSTHLLENPDFRP